MIGIAYLYFNHPFIIPIPMERMRMPVIIAISFNTNPSPTKLFYSNESLAYMCVLGD